MDTTSYGVSENFLNRELSWLEFNQRVMMEAANPDNPVFERMKFLSIVSSNLDEFFMIRVASLRDQCNAGYKRPDPAGYTPKKQLAAITERTQRMVEQQYQILREGVMTDLLREGENVISATLADGWYRGFLVYPGNRNLYG